MDGPANSNKKFSTTGSSETEVIPIVKVQEKVSNYQGAIPEFAHMETTPENKGTLPISDTAKKNMREDLPTPESF